MSDINPYERFQADAVRSIAEDFKREPEGRFLLVIPTGGGKTYTAVKAVSALIAADYFDGENRRILWVAHRNELLDQARETFLQFDSDQGTNATIRVDFVMRSKVAEQLSPGHPYQFSVIDEAHHAAASEYQPLFDDPRRLGVLGLTATPSRHDGKSLDFSKESFSIGFPDLIELGVLLAPEIVQVKTGVTLNITSLDPDVLDELDSDERNDAIVAALRSRAQDCQKAVVFVGSVKHARNLYQLLQHSLRDSNYEFVGCIAGGKPSTFDFTSNAERHEDRDTFIARLKASKRSVVVNVDVLTEGYDDPGIDTVVMARPTNSKLVYMQAAGRAVRLDPENPDKRPVIFEVEDDLPNIRYRVDNRWLFSEISDALEPAVVDHAYQGDEGRTTELREICDAYAVKPEDRPDWSEIKSDRIELLLFRYFDRSMDGHRHLALVGDDETRSDLQNLFNWLSARMDRFAGKPHGLVYQTIQHWGERFSCLQGERGRKVMLQAMDNAFGALSTPRTEKSPDQPHPWITLVTLRKSWTELDACLEAFLEGMENAPKIRTQLLDRAYENGDVLFRLPLPFKGYQGVILPPPEASTLDDTINELQSRAGSSIDEQWSRREELLAYPLPIAPRHVPYLPLLCREATEHKYPLKK